MERIRTERRDLSIIGMDRIPLFESEGMVLEVVPMSRSNNELAVHLTLDGKDVMSTTAFEHQSMINAIAECPDDSRVLVGGLGFGMILLYLAESGKSSSVMVVEKDSRVLERLKEPIEIYLRREYPDFLFEVVEGDLFEEIERHGLFDWIFVDLCSSVPIEFRKTIDRFLTARGVQTHFSVTA